MMKIQNAYLVMLRKQTPYQELVEIHSCNNLLPEDSKQQVKITELPEWPSWEWVSMDTIGAFNQPAQPIQQPTAQQAPSTAEDPYEKLTKLKQLVDANVITQEEFDEAKKKLLGL